MCKKIIMAVVICILMIFVFEKRDIRAANVIDSKTEGNVTWTLYDDGLLNIRQADNPNQDQITYKNYSSKIITVVIENGVIDISESAFLGCSNLTNVTIPNSVTSIGYAAFSQCSSLPSITIPSSVIHIENGAFSDCNSLTNITIPNSITSISDGVFSGCNSLTNVTIPNSVTSIGDSAFSNCSSLTNVIIPNSVTSIDFAAFSNCSNLTNVTIPNSVISIGDCAFSECSSLKTVSISDALEKSIDIDDVFYGTIWRLIKLGSIKGSCGNHIYELNANGNLIISNGNGEFSVPATLYSYLNIIKIITINNNVNDISFSDLDEYQKLEKIVNNSDCTISLTTYKSNTIFSWCDINDTTDPIFYLSKGTAIKVTPKLVKHYDIIFDGNGATSGSMANIKAEVDKYYRIINSYTKDGYKFKLWEVSIGSNTYFKYDGENIYVSLDFLKEHDIKKVTIKAQWEDDYSKYSISFDGNGATSGTMAEIIGTADSSVAIPRNTFVKSGYKFKYWKYTIGSNTDTINDGSSLYVSEYSLKNNNTKSVTLIAEWEEDANYISKNETEGNSDTDNKATSNQQSESKTEPIPKGSPIINASGTDTGYVVTSSDNNNLTVEYVGTPQDKTKKTITVPQTVTDTNGIIYTVTSIKSGAFKDYKKLTKITIPKTVIYIDSKAFKGCKHLKKITIYANPNLKISKKAFKNIPSDAVIKIKGLKGKQKKKLIKTIKKHTKAKVK